MVKENDAEGQDELTWTQEEGDVPWVLGRVWMKWSSIGIVRPPGVNLGALLVSGGMVPDTGGLLDVWGSCWGKQSGPDLFNSGVCLTEDADAGDIGLGPGRGPEDTVWLFAGADVGRG